MKRKIVKLGPATLVVSLPSKWIKKINIQAGDEIEVNEQEEGLLISKDKRLRKIKETLDFTKIDMLLERITNAKFMKGCDEIEIKIDTSEKARQIQKRVDSMIGMEVIEQSKNRMLLKDMGAGNEDNIETISKRLLYLLQTISNEILKSIENNDLDIEYIKDMELNVNRFTEYGFRLLNRKGHKNPKKTAVSYCLLFLLEELGDYYKNLISYIIKNKIILNKKLSDLYIKINKYHKNLTSLFLNYTLDKAIALAKERDEITNIINSYLEKTKSVKETIILKTFEQITGTIIKIMNELMNAN